jgi:hypothetical protein
VGFDRNGITIPRRPFDSKPGSTFCENDNIGRCPSGAAADIRDGAALPRRFDVQGWNDLYRDRPGRLQRSRWCTESRQVGRGRCAGRRGVAVSGCRPRRPCVVSGSVKGRAGRKGSSDDRQHRSDRRHRQVQGRDLFEIEAAQGFLLAPWGRRRVLDEVACFRRIRATVHRRPFICAGADAVPATHCPGALAARVHWGARRRPASGWARARCRSVGTVPAARSCRGRRRRIPRRISR